MKVYIISLKESTVRRSKVTATLESHGINYNFHTTDRLSEKEIDQIYPTKNKIKTLKYKGYQLTNSEVGCFNSHIELWKKCLEINKPIIILEDNIEILVDDLEIFIELIKNNIEKFGLIKLGNIFDRKILSRTKLTENHDIVSYSKGGCGTQGYAITPKTARIFLENSMNFFEPVDDFMEAEWRNNCIVYGIEPPIIKRAQITSTIGARKVKSRSLILKATKELYRFYKQLRQKIFNLRKFR